MSKKSCKDSDEQWFSGEAPEDYQTEFKKTSQSDPDCPDQNRAQLAMNQGQWATAEKYLLRSLKRNPNRKYAWRMLVEVLMELKKWTQVREILLTRFSMPFQEQDYLDLGRACEHLGRDTEAIESYQKVIRLNENAIEGRIGLGRIYFRQGHFQQALSELKQADCLLLWTRSRISPKLRLLIGDVELASGDPRQAIHTLQLLEYHEAFMHVYGHRQKYLLGRCLEHLGQTEMARSYYSQALELQALPEYREVLENLNTVISPEPDSD